jgi:hypothetical protein
VTHHPIHDGLHLPAVHGRGVQQGRQQRLRAVGPVRAVGGTGPHGHGHRSGDHDRSVPRERAGHRRPPKLLEPRRQAARTGRVEHPHPPITRPGSRSRAGDIRLGRGHDRRARVRQHRRDDHAARLARPRRAEQQNRPLRPREPPLSIVPRAEPHATTGPPGERADCAQRVRASRDRSSPCRPGPSAGGEDRVNDDQRDKTEDQHHRDPDQLEVDRTDDQDPRAQAEDQHRWPCDPPAAPLGLM